MRGPSVILAPLRGPAGVSRPPCSYTGTRGLPLASRKSRYEIGPPFVGMFIGSLAPFNRIRTPDACMRPLLSMSRFPRGSVSALDVERKEKHRRARVDIRPRDQVAKPYAGFRGRLRAL